MNQMISFNISKFKKKTNFNEEKFSINSKCFSRNTTNSSQIGFADEFKKITEFVKTSKNNFNKHLYQKVTSTYCSEQSSIKSKKSVNVVDILALDNFNRLYSKMSLPMISQFSSDNKIIIPYQQGENKNHVKRMSKLKTLNVLDKTKKFKIQPKHVSILDFNFSKNFSKQ